MRRSPRLASAAERQRTHNSEDREGARPMDMRDVERTPSGAGLRPRSLSELRNDDFDVGGSGGGLGDLSAPRQGGASPLELRTDDFDVRDRMETAEEQDARLDREEEERLHTLPGWEGRFAYLEEQRRLRELETWGVAAVTPTTWVSVGRLFWERSEKVLSERISTWVAGERVSPRVTRDRVSPWVVGERVDQVEMSTATIAASTRTGPTTATAVTTTVATTMREMLALVVRDPTLPPLHPDDFAHVVLDADGLVHVGLQDPFPHTGRRSDERRPPGGTYSPPPYLVQSPRWSGSSLSDIRGRESGVVEGGSGRRSGGESAESMPPPPAQAAEASDEETAARAHIGGSPPPVRGGVAGGWAAHRRVTDRLRADYDVGRGAFAGRLSPQRQAAEGGSGRPSLHMAGRMLGLSRSATRRSLVLPAARTLTDMQQGQHYTSGEEGLMMRRGTRRHSVVTEVEARLTAEIAADQAALDAIQRQRETIAAEEAEDEDTSTVLWERPRASSCRAGHRPLFLFGRTLCL
ncbi:hypothetical protein CBR_g37400 [Chara braunii]|uniref:Uncharacterized protein n=1 Tax=Chara braunii TaxID=69332 RepID=A0A388LMY3_CHABU|nr:hypothetical protein CBR_g37400 [Chara braunii]|eukprot:GBG83595.1 hypothetical protein CBR_g37400 [Chara braunii]